MLVNDAGNMREAAVPVTIALLEIRPKHLHVERSLLAKKIVDEIRIPGLSWGAYYTPFTDNGRDGLKICATLEDRLLAPATVTAAVLALKTESYLVHTVKVPD